jgi:site-specific recombinase XerD
MYRIVKSRMAKLGITSLHRGPHSLRHACAGHLVAEGFSLKEIGDHLGHRSAFSTRTYAKVDLPGLREVASFDLGDLL